MAAKRIQRKHQQVPRTLKTIQRSEKLIQAASLPRILNMNARSIYNKVEEFKTFVNEREIDLVCMSETWEEMMRPWIRSLILKISMSFLVDSKEEAKVVELQ